MRGTRDPGLLALVVVAALAACSAGEGDPATERGRQVYLAQCTACHANDPGQNGPVGPAVKGSTKTLLETKVLTGTYPTGYTPKRPSAVMQPMPQLSASIDDLAAYLR
jgi:mono/diheme cytochrome c family protein